MTLDEARRVEAIARPVARALIVLIVGGLVAIAVALQFAHLGPVRIVVTWAAPMLLVASIGLALRFRRASPERANPWLLGTGIAAVVSSVAFDVIVTIVEDPRLQLEANPFVRAFVDNGYSMTFVKVYAVACQGLFVVLLGILLSAALAHAEPLRILAWAMRPRNRKEFVAAAMRGTPDASPFHGLRLRDWKAMKAHSSVAFMAPTLCIATALGRTALAVEWLGFRPARELVLIVVVLAAMIAINVAWSLSWRRGPPPELAAEIATLAAAGAPRSRWSERAAWLMLPLLALGFLAAREVRKASDVEQQLEGRIETLEREVDAGRDAELRIEELGVEVERLQIEWDQSPASRALPCRQDDATLAADVRALLEPLGVRLRGHDAVSRPRRLDFYAERPIHVVLPDEQGAAMRLSACLVGAERLIRLPVPEIDAVERLVVAFEYDCPDLRPRLDDQREPPWGRDDLVWPFDRFVVRREREIDRLRAERDRHADALLLLERKRMLEDSIARRKWIAEDLARRIASME